MNRELLKECSFGLKLNKVFVNGKSYYIVDFPLVPDELSCDNFELFSDYTEACSCYAAFIRGYEYAKSKQ